MDLIKNVRARCAPNEALVDRLIAGLSAARYDQEFVFTPLNAIVPLEDASVSGLSQVLSSLTQEGLVERRVMVRIPEHRIEAAYASLADVPLTYIADDGAIVTTLLEHISSEYRATGRLRFALQ
jgi:hypothetical protein